MRNIYKYLDKKPVIKDNCFIAPGARIIGNVVIGYGSSVWYNVVIRGDVNYIRIGNNTNIQDNTMIHADSGRSGISGSEGLPTILGDNVTVGHNCILHACTIEDCCMIGMGSIVLDGAVIGRGTVIGAGAVITKKTVIPPFSVVVGIPAKVIKTLDEASLEERLNQAQHYYRLAQENKESLMDNL